MKKADVVIIGSSAAGMEAARTVQKLCDIDKVIVVRKEQRALVPCGIPYIFGTLGSIEKNVLPDALLGDAELVIDEVTSIDRGEKVVITARGEKIGYRKLILATGSRPVVPPIPGAELENVFTVRKEWDYLQRLQDALAQAKDVVIVGGGFIGVELADECRKRGLNVTIVELLKHCLYLNCDEEFCERIENKLREAGVQILTNHRVESIGGDKRAEYVVCNGKKLKADVVILAIGVTPNNELAREAGLPIGEQRGIMVDQFMATADPDIFAVGDCAEKFSFFTGKPANIRLASVAATEARIAAANLFEPRRRRNLGTVGVFSTIVSGTAVGVAGLTERLAKEAGFDVIVGEATAVDKHPGAMPGAAELRVKLIFDRRSRRIIGGEACGGVTAGEMANIMGALILNKMTADEVATLQVGTHPALTASPLVYPIVNAAQDAEAKLRP